MIRWRLTKLRRRRILQRDGHRCQHPGCGDPTAGPFEIDHVVGLFFQEIDPDKWTIEILEADDNLRTLCIACHKMHTAEQAALRGKLRRLTSVRKRTRRKIPSRPFPRRLKGSPPIQESVHVE